MTVAELIAKLQEMPQDAPVVVQTDMGFVVIAEDAELQAELRVRVAWGEYETHAQAVEVR